MGRYTPRKNKYADISASYGSHQAPRQAYQETAADKQHSKDADFWNFVGDVAPVAGGVLGAVGGGILGGVTTGGLGIIPGAAAGGTLGYNLGQAGGQAAHSYGESIEAPAGEAEAKFNDEESRRLQDEQMKQDRKSALINALMSMRR